MCCQETKNLICRHRATDDRRCRRASIERTTTLTKQLVHPPNSDFIHLIWCCFIKMSDRRPPPPTPAGFWQQHQPSQQQQQSYPTNYARAQHPPPPPPPLAQASTVPPPLYGYNPAAAGSHYNNQGNRTHQKHATESTNKRRRISSNKNINIDDPSPWNCQPCQVSLESQAALQAHVNAHISCTLCNFTASQKVVNGHFASAHGKFSGGGFKTVTIAVPGCRVQRFNICVGNHPDDVKKWIQERKKKFPRTKRKDRDNQQETSDSKKEKDSALGSLLEGYGSSSSEDDDNDEKPATSHSAADTTTTLANTEAADNAESQTRPPNYRTRPCKYFMRNGSCRNGDKCNFSHEMQNQRTTNNPWASSNKRQRRGPSSSSTLLRKLLENDARREATLSIQLLEYLADCNYLQKQQSGGETKSNGMSSS